MQRINRNIALYIQRYLNTFDPVIKQLPENLIDSAKKFGPPIFLIGAPRSGTTALAEHLYSHYQLSYISNIMALAPKYMIRLTRWFPSFACYYRQKYYSNYGYISGLTSPNESGNIMQHWFGQYTNCEHSNDVRATIAAITLATGRPVMVKNLANTCRLSNIIEILPNSRFIYLKRNTLFTAQSILLARKRHYSAFEKWWSVKPPGQEAVINEDPYYQVIWQVITLEKMAEEFVYKNSSQSLSLSYESFSSNPEEESTRISDKFGLQPENKKTTHYWKDSNTVKLDQLNWKRLKYAYERVLHDFES